MDFLNWQTMVGVIGGLGTITATTWKLISLIRTARSQTAQKISDLSEETAVQRALITDLRNDVERLRDSHDKMSDLLIKLLTEK